MLDGAALATAKARAMPKRILEGWPRLERRSLKTSKAWRNGRQNVLNAHFERIAALATAKARAMPKRILEGWPSG